ncbi:MAG: DUF6465 family protein [Acutalibacteraceae bacterium]
MAATKKTTAEAETKTTKKTTKKETEAKAPAKRCTRKAAEKVTVYVEFGGVKVSVDDIVNNVKLTNGKAAKEYTIYVKPEDSKAYFVADGEEKEMDVFFC